MKFSISRIKSQAERGDDALDALVPGEDDSIEVLLTPELDGGLLQLSSRPFSLSRSNELLSILRFRGGSSIARVADTEGSNEAVRCDRLALGSWRK